MELTEESVYIPGYQNNKGTKLGFITRQKGSIWGHKTDYRHYYGLRSPTVL